MSLDDAVKKTRLITRMYDNYAWSPPLQQKLLEEFGKHLDILRKEKHKDYGERNNWYTIKTHQPPL